MIFQRIVVSTLFCLLAGCAFQQGSNSHETDDKDKENHLLKFRRYSSTPETGAVFISSQELQAGDILLSSSRSFVSYGIRLVNSTSVSHAAVYLGNGEVAEAIGSGVRIISIDDFINHSTTALALRPPGFQPKQSEALRAFASSKLDMKYNYNGIVLMVPYSLTRRLCDLPLFIGDLKYSCNSLLAVLQLGDKDSMMQESYFCSQFVLDSYAYAGYPITDATSFWVSPDDLLHMREDDLHSIKPRQALIYAGHLKHPSLTLTASEVAKAESQ